MPIRSLLQPDAPPADSFTARKRLVYLALLPAVGIIALVDAFVSAKTQVPGMLPWPMELGLAIGLLGLTVRLWRRTHYRPWLENLYYLSIGGFILAGFWLGLRPLTAAAPVGEFHSVLGFWALWFVMYGLLAIITLSPPRGQQLVTVFYGASFLPTAAHLLTTGTPSLKFMFFLNFHLITGVVLLIVFRLVSLYQHQALYDHVSGALSRQRLRDLALIEVDRARRHAKPLSVILFDLDHFKQINDEFGHAAGDRVLREAVAHARTELRRSDLLGRWGGEEFLVLTPETSAAGALVVAERLRASLGRSAALPGRVVTASFGVAAFQAPDTFEALVRRADEALYTAKHAGRNQVAVQIASAASEALPEAAAP